MTPSTKTGRPGEPGAGGNAPARVALPADEVLDETEAVEERIALSGRSLRAHTARGAIVNSAFQVGLGALGLVRRVGVAAFLTTTEFGLWGLLVATLIAITWLKQVGVSDKYVQQDEGDQETAFQRAFTLEVAYSGCIFAVMVVALPLYAAIYGRPEMILPGVVLSTAVLGSALEAPIWIAYRQMRFVRERTLEAIDPVTTTVVTIVLAVAGAGYWSLVLGAVAGNFAGGFAALVTCPYKIRLRFSRSSFREYLTFSWPLFISSAGALVVAQGTVLVGNWSVGLAGLGAVALATSFTDFADRADAIISRTIYPAVCAVRERTELLFEAFVKSNRLALMWGLPFGVGVALFAPDLIQFALGERWRSAQGLIQALGLVVAFRQVAFNWNVFMQAIGNTRPMAVSGTANAIVFCAVTAPLMFAVGLTGFAIGISVALVIELAIRGFFLARLFQGFRLLRHLMRAVAPSLPAILAVGAIRALSWGGTRTLGQALGELTLYVLLTLAATAFLERRLIGEAMSYLRARTAS